MDTNTAATEAAKGAVSARVRRLAASAALFLVPGAALFALYAPALDYDYVWTDTSAIAGGTLLRPAGELTQAFREPLHRIPHRGNAARQSYYRPLQVIALSWVADRSGAEPRNFRLLGLAFGALALGVWALLVRRLCGRTVPALAAALFVAMHPVGVETYVWIAGTSGAMSALFGIAALALGLMSCTPRSPLAAAGLAAASLIALLAALLSKERAIMEPVLLVALFASVAQAAAASTSEPGRAALDRLRAAAVVATHALLAGCFFFVWRPSVLGDSSLALPPIGDSVSVQIASAVANWPASLAWLFIPLHSSTSDVLQIVPSPFDPRALFGVALALGSAVAWWLCLRRGRPLLALGLAWIWIAYAPTAGLLPMLHAAGERYLFLSAFGASLVLADLLGLLLRRGGATALWIAAAVPVLFVAQRTHARLPLWESNLSLFQHEIAHDPAFREGYFLVAAELHGRGQYEEAAEHLRRVLAGGPAFEGTASYLNPLSTNEVLCTSLLALGRHAAIQELAKRLAVSDPFVARAPSVRACFGQALDLAGRPRDALAIYEGVSAELQNETPPMLYVMIARNYLRLGQTREALPWLARARASSSRDPALRTALDQLERWLRRAARPPDPAGP